MNKIEGTIENWNNWKLGTDEEFVKLLEEMREMSEEEYKRYVFGDWNCER